MPQAAPEPISPGQRALNARLLGALHRVDAVGACMALDDGANPSAIDRATGCSALFWAAGYGMTGVMRRLITEGADINSRSLTGRTPLFAAATNESDAAARVLLEDAGGVAAVDGGENLRNIFVCGGHCGKPGPENVGVECERVSVKWVGGWASNA